MKKPLVSIPKQSIRIKKPKKIEQEDDCKRKLKEIGQRMLDAPLFDLKMRFNDEHWGLNPVENINRDNDTIKHGIWIPDSMLSGGKSSIHGALGNLLAPNSIDELPEKVCCAVLKHLRAASNGNSLSEETLIGWKISSTIKLTNEETNESYWQPYDNETHSWVREVHVENAQGPIPKFIIGMTLKIFVNSEMENLVNVTRIFKKCNSMFKEAVG